MKLYGKYNFFMKLGKNGNFALLHHSHVLTLYALSSKSRSHIINLNIIFFFNFHENCRVVKRNRPLNFFLANCVTSSFSNQNIKLRNKYEPIISFYTGINVHNKIIKFIFRSINYINILFI